MTANKLTVTVSGAGGRLGRRILARVLSQPDMQLGGGVVRAGSAEEGSDLGVLAQSQPIGVVARSGLDGALEHSHVLIETSPRRVALEHAERAAAQGKPILMATTGFEAGELAALRQLGARVPIVIAPNLSLGVAVLLELVERAAAQLPGYDLELLEIHHGQKRDAPSGTAWSLARAAAAARGQDIEKDAILARAGETGKRGAREIGMQSLRGGDTVGEHTVYLIGHAERLELSHRAMTRDVFADGAVVAARFLGHGRAPGVYSMRDVIAAQRSTPQAT